MHHRSMTLVALIAASTCTGVAGATTAGTALASTHRPEMKHLGPYSVSTVLSGSSLSHAVGTGHAALSNPDDIVALGHTLFVGFQNGVGSKGEPSSTGNTASTLVEFTTSGAVVHQWDLMGKIDGLGSDPTHDRVIVTVNEDGNSSLYVIDLSASVTSQVRHYTYAPSPLPHGGGTDAVSVDKGRILISASAPTDAMGPAVYSVTLGATGTASFKAVFLDDSTATSVTSGKPTKLALTDPDSNTIVPASSPNFRGDFMLDGQGDNQQIYVHNPGSRHQSLTVLDLSQSVDDSAFATSRSGELYATDPTDNTVSALTGTFQPGDVFVAVTPCNTNSAPSTCPAPGYSANYLGGLDLSTGTITPVVASGAPLVPVGLLFLSDSGS